MKIGVCFLILFVLISCKQEEKVVLKEDFVFGYNSGIRVKSFSFKNDTVFMAINYPKNHYVFYYPLEDKDKKQINNFLDTIKKQHFKKEYIQKNIVDAGMYQFQFLDRNQLIYVYGFQVEEYEIEDLKELNKFSSFLIDFEMSKMIKYNDSTYYGMEKVYWNLDVDFGNLKRLQEPEPELDPFYIDS